MELTDDNLRTLSEYLKQTLSPNPNIRWPAEKFLRTVEATKNYPILLLHLVNKAEIDMTIRVAGSITFKNFIKKNWAPDDDSATDKIDPGDRETIKQVIVDSMLVAPSLVQKQLSDAVSTIGKYDFPAKWPTLLTSMVDKFSTGDFNIINGVLHTAHSIFKRYRYEFKSNELWTEIKFVLETFAKPLTDLFVVTHTLTTAHANNPAALKIIYSSLLLISKIFYSLNFQDLPEFFEDNMQVWMSHFHLLLTTDVKCLETDSEDEAGLIEQIKSQVCFNVSLYAQMYDEEFYPYLSKFVTDIWSLLVSTNQQPKYDLLVSHALQFLSKVASRAHCRSLFEDPSTLNSICEKVIIPNIQFRDSDLELFEDNPEEYMKRDIEGSDVETRRRSACDLVKVLATQFDEKVTAIFSQFVQAMLTEYTADPATKWRHKNGAVYLVVSLAGRGGTQKHGVTQTSSLVNINDFAKQYIIPELNKPIDTLPVVKADSIKYLMMFRSVLPPDLMIASLPLMVKHLRSESQVVHSYAASTLDKIFCVRMNNTPIVNSATLSPLAGELLSNLFHVLTLKGSEENEYAMKAIMRSFTILQGEVTPFLGELLPKLTEKLALAAKNPNKPHFNHYLFEAITLSINIVCKKTPETVTSFEEVLFPIFQVILQEEVQDFLPYVFQVLSVLLRLHQEEDVPGPYLGLYSCLLSPTLWERQANISPLASLVRAIVIKAKPHLYQNTISVSGLLGVFQKLIASKVYDHEGFSLIQTMMEHCPREQMKPFLKQILMLLFQRVTSSKTPKYVKGLLVFFCFYCLIYGAQDFVEVVDQIQPQMFSMIVERLFVPDAPKINGVVDRKITSVGLTKLICEARSLIEGNYNTHWSSLLKLALRVLESGGEEEEKEDIPLFDTEEIQGYEAAYSELVYAEKLVIDPVQGIGDPRLFLAVELSKLSSTIPGKLSNVISQSLTPTEQQVLQTYMAQASVNLS